MSLDLPVTEIILERGDTGLGFNIRGGVDIPHLPGDPGIFVTKLKENGAAFKDGRLKEGDKILEINGSSVEKKTHNEAVQIFLSAGNDVHLKVQCGAEKVLLERIEEKKKESLPSPLPVRRSKFSLFYFLLGFVSVTGLGFLIFRRVRRIKF